MRVSFLRVNYLPFWLIISTVYAISCVGIEFSDSPVSGFGGLVNILSQWFVVSFFASMIIGLMSLSRWAFIVLFPIFTVLSSVMSYYTLTMGVHLTSALVEVTLVNDFSTWATLISWKLILTMVAALITGLLVGLFRFRYVINPRQPFVWTLCFLMVMMMPFVVVKRFRSAVVNRVPYVFWFSTKDYIANRHEININDLHTFDNLAVVKDSVSPIVVFVIGESLRPDHLGINGYERQTTPHLQSEANMVSLKSMTSPEIFTHLSVPYIVTRADRDHEDRRWNEQSFVSIFKKSGYKTSWISNQDMAREYSYFMAEADTLVMTSPEKSIYSFVKWLDSDMLVHVENILEGEDAAHLVVLHSIGSHWWYPSHYSDSSALYRPEVDSRVLSELSHEQIVNSYDNTIVETDRFLYSLFNLLRDKNSVVLFVSDHGESMGENGEYLHTADFPQLHPIASFVWYSDKYEKTWPEKIRSLKSKEKKPMDTDVFFYSVIDAASLHTDVIDTTRSLFR